MLKVKAKHVSGLVAICAGVMVSGFLAVAGAATNASIQDRRVGLVDAQRMADAAASSEFPIVVNELVLERLNRYLGTPDGRAFMRRSLAQMQNQKDGIVESLDRYGLPHELLAVPLIESGYRNLPHDGNPAHGAGLWMFIAATARNYGLRVDDEIDERLNVSLETDAAMRLLGGLHLQFKDWGLALLGYNGGSGLVNRAIRETGSRDVWEIIREGYENDPRYVASVMAAVLIIMNPTSVND